MVERKCLVCGKIFYVTLSETKRNEGRFCSTKCWGIWRSQNLRGDKSPMWGKRKSGRWKGGRSKDSAGYILIKVYPDSFFYPMVECSGYVPEHRLIMAESLSRCLKSYEIVHHINGIRDDNRIENLELFPSQTEHLPSIALRQYTNRLEKKNNKLEKRIKELEDEIKFLKEETKNGSCLSK